MVEGPLLRFQTGKGRKQRRVYVYDSARIEINELFTEDPEITRQYNEPSFRRDPARLESGNSLLVIVPIFLRDSLVV